MNNKLVKNTMIVLAVSVLAKLLAYLWEAMLAAWLGAGDEADALSMTTSVFNILYPILDLGIWKVFLPAYQSKRSAGLRQDAEKIANGALSFFLLLSVALVGFLILCAEPIIGLLAPGFPTKKQILTVEFLRLSAPAYLLMSAASILGAILQCHDRFLGSQLREIGTHLSKILFVLICFRFLGVWAAVAAIVVGSVFRVLIQLPFFNWGWRWRPGLDLKDRDMRAMIRGLPSVALTAAILHINSLVDRIFASGARGGAVACLNYGNRLMTVFSGLISTAVSTSTYPVMIDHIANGRADALRELLVKIIHALCYLIIPITVYCAVFSRQLVTVAFQRGEFDETATLLTAGIFAGYCVGMLFTALETVFSNVFYGYGDTRTTLIISSVMILVNVGLDILFYALWGVPGLALATSAAAILGLGLRLILLRRYIRLPWGRLLREIAVVAGSTGLAVLAAWLLCQRLTALPALPALLLSLAVSAAIYLPMTLLLRSEAIRAIMQFGKKKLRRAAKPKD